MAIHARDPITGRIIKTQSIEERFWSHVQVCEQGRTCVECCWPWTGKIDDGGYGHFALTATKDIGAHRQAFIFTHDTFDPTLLVCHNCPHGDLRSCCNGAHLWQGTDKDNSQDMVRKGRSLTGTRNPGVIHRDKVRAGLQTWNADHPERRRRGERHPYAALTDITARAIYALKDERSSQRGGLVQTARQFGVSEGCMWAVWMKHTWKHIHNY